MSLGAGRRDDVQPAPGSDPTAAAHHSAAAVSSPQTGRAGAALALEADQRAEARALGDGMSLTSLVTGRSA